MRYDPDLTKLSLAAYRELLRGQTLLPSRRMLLEDLDTRFTALTAQGITTVADLRKALASPVKIAAFAKTSGIPTDYLTLLKRETGSLKAKIVPLHNFPDMDSVYIASLEAKGIKTSKAYLESAQNTGDELYALCNLVRINGIGTNAAKMLYAAGYRSPADIAAATAEAMLSRIAADNASHKYYQGTLGLKDMQFCIDMANLLETFSAASR